MPDTMPIIEARKKLTSLPEEFELHPETGAIAVTRRGKPVLAIMSWEMYEALTETLEISGDEAMMSALRQGIKEAQQGLSLSWDEAKRELGA